jgi:hypothetical protein
MHSARWSGYPVAAAQLDRRALPEIAAMLTPAILALVLAGQALAAWAVPWFAWQRELRSPPE